MSGQALLPGETFDAAIIDIGLPKGNGLELTRRIRHNGLALPVLILMARDALQDRVQGLDWGRQAGFSGFQPGAQDVSGSGR